MRVTVSSEIAHCNQFSSDFSERKCYRIRTSILQLLSEPKRYREIDKNQLDISLDSSYCRNVFLPRDFFATTFPQITEPPPRGTANQYERALGR